MKRMFIISWVCLCFNFRLFSNFQSIAFILIHLHAHLWMKWRRAWVAIRRGFIITHNRIYSTHWWDALKHEPSDCMWIARFKWSASQLFDVLSFFFLLIQWRIKSKCEGNNHWQAVEIMFYGSIRCAYGVVYKTKPINTMLPDTQPKSSNLLENGHIWPCEKIFCPKFYWIKWINFQTLKK